MKDNTPYGKLLMLQSVIASPDGKVSQAYTVGKEYNLPKHLYYSFIDMGVAKLTDQEVETAVIAEDRETAVIKEKTEKKPKKRGRKKKVDA